MNRPALALGLAVAASAAGLVGEREASACGGCFHPPTQTTSDITDERMLLTVSTTQTTLYDQIRYSGSPSSFAWVLPIHGTVTVGLSADVLFNSMDHLTETTINPPVVPCPGPTNCRVAAPQAAAGGSSSGSADAGVALVTATNQENVGPYATVQLHSTDPAALNDWLSQNGYVIPDTVTPIIDEYVTEGFDFLAMKLLPNQGVQAMRPVRVTMPGASLSLPLRMAAIGTGASVGITIWVVADGRYEPQNFPFFRIDDSQLVWDFSVSLSNYTTLRVQNEANLGNKGWEIESSIALNEQLITNVIQSGGQYYGNFGGGLGPAYVADPSLDYLPVGDPDAGTNGDGGTAQTAEEARAADIATLFTGLTGPSVRVTRIRSDIIHSAMNVDFLLQASADQSELSNIRNVTQSVNLTCPVYNGCTQVGSAPYSPDGGGPTSSQSGSSSGSNGGADAGLGVTLGGSSSSSGGGLGSGSSSSSGSSGAPGTGASPSSGSGSTGGGCAASTRPSPAAPAAVVGLLGFALLTGLRRRKAAKRDARPGSR